MCLPTRPPHGIGHCSLKGMNTIDPNILVNHPVPSFPSPVEARSCEGGDSTMPSTPPRISDRVTWSPGLWWLLFRYEYLFDGLLPQPAAQETIIYERPDQTSEGTPLQSAMPHWDHRQAVNPPPALATMPQAAEELPATSEAPVNQPACVGAFVDLIA